MKNQNFIVFTTLFLFSCFGEASEHVREDLVIKRFTIVSADRPQNTASQNLIRAYFEPEGAWGTSNCREDSADLDIADSHMYSAGLAAFAAGKTVRVVVEDTARLLGSVCRITSFSVDK